MPDDEKDRIEERAAEPASVEIDGQKVTQHSLKDQIEADKYLAAKEAAKSRKLGVRLVKIIPPGAV
ncbi:MAG: hypothetical protein WC712_13100 [Candidatus Brocadiia bacterium]